MIPAINIVPSQQNLSSGFHSFLKQQNFSGEITNAYADRIIGGTDNSIYKLLPDIILYPKTSEDIEIAVKALQKKQFSGLSLTGRGAGTGTNGQSLNQGAIIDVSRHMNRILDFDPLKGLVRIEPGVVLDQLNEYLKPFGMFFGPSLSTSNRATLGGMVNTDAAGKGSRIYGKTSEHVIELTTILSDGERLISRELSSAEWQETAKKPGIAGQIYQTLADIVIDKQNLIQKQLPDLDRFITGYNLTKVYDKTQKSLNLNFLLAGSEGTLGITSEIVLRVLPLPEHKTLMTVEYSSFDAALQSARILLESEPLAIETIDEKVMLLARQDPVWNHLPQEWREHIHPQTKTINLVEFVGDDFNALRRRTEHLSVLLSEEEKKESGILQHHSVFVSEEIESFWAVRKKGVGLLGNAPGARKPIAFIEDCAVPPETLRDFIREFRSILDENGLEYGMYGHIDVGCLHVRPALNLKQSEDEERIRLLSDRIQKLCLQCGGVIWGEHGKGFRGEYLPEYYGSELYEDLRRIKEVFDPKNLFNPGKLVTPLNLKEARVDRLDKIPFRGHFDREIPLSTRSEYEAAFNCNGNGVCLSYRYDDLMCPSYKALRDKKHSPKGRAELIKEWIFLLQKNGLQVTQATLFAFRPSVLDFFKRIWNTFGGGKHKRDFSKEVAESLQECLSCKACSTLCPIRVDISDFKSRFFAFYYTRYQRPLKDYAVSQVERLACLQAFLPSVWRLLLKNRFIQKMTEKVFGFRDAPLPSVPSLKVCLRQENVPLLSRFDRLTPTTVPGKERIILLQDAFTSFYDAETVMALCQLLNFIGVEALVAPFSENGKPLHIKGFLHKFQRVAQQQTQRLEQLAIHGLDLVGIEPSVTLTYREEYPQWVGRQVPVKLFHDWLYEWLQNHPEFSVNSAKQAKEYIFLAHCSEKTSSPETSKRWQYIFSRFGLNLSTPDAGCCGMAGTYGHEVSHYETSRKIYALSWENKITNSEQRVVLADGYSCRSQVKRFSGLRAQHPGEALCFHLSIR